MDQGMDIPARYFDGVRPVPQQVTLRATPQGVEIHLSDEAPPIVWPFAEARLDSLKPEARLHRVSRNIDTGERLVVEAGAFTSGFAPYLKAFGKGRAGEASGLRIALWTGGAIASVVFLFFVGLPLLARVLAPLVPWSWETTLGKSVEPQVLEMFSKGSAVQLCGEENSPGKAALDAMVARLSAGAKLPAPVKVEVLDTAVTNAFALPGGHIYLFRPIIEKAGSPGEVAGVLAHEIGHVVHRDAMRGLIHDGALSLLIGAVLGDVTGGSTVTVLAKMMAGSAYSRENESEADRVSVDLMRHAGADPRAINGFFRRLGAGEKSSPSILDALSSHPVTAERITAVEKLAADAPQGGRPILSAPEWQALRGICNQTRPSPAAKS